MEIPDCATATEYLAMVKSQFMTKKYAGGGIREYILEMSHMANKIKTMNMSLLDPFVIQLVFKSIPKDYLTFHVN